VRPGCSITILRCPKNAPMSESGSEIPNHITTKAKNVPKGIAFDEFLDHTKRLSMKTMVNKIPGTKVAVTIAFLVQELPLKTLYRRAE